MLGWFEAARANDDFANSKAWLNLLHYQKTLTGYKSEADGKGFFFSPDGKRSPSKELEATLKALTEDPTKSCKFPARRKLLEKQGHTFAQVTCDEYETWRKGLPVSHLSIIFATAYPNNPASMFGHTFLRLNGPGEGRDLLDYAVNFAATTGTAGGVEFAVFGVFGGYEGHYSLAPYFIKVNEYNHGEARDLWEYPLKLSPEAIDMLLAHLWEIESNTFFDYYFFDENCSWQILRLIEAADPQIDLSSLSSFYVIPGDTVQILSKNKLLEEPKFRSSLRRQYRGMKNAETETEKLDKKLLYYRLKDRVGKNNPQAKSDYHQSLMKRSKDSTPAYAPELPQAFNRPDIGHGVRRVSFTQGDGFRRMSFRFAQHDLLDSDLGHEPWSALDVLRITPEERDGKISLREFSLVDVTSLHAWDGLDFEPSWYLRVSAESPQEFSCEKCFTGSLRLGVGQTFKYKDSLIAALFLGTRSYAKGPDHDGINGGLSARSIFGASFEKWKILLDLEKLWGLGNDKSYLGELSLSWAINSSWALRGHTARFFSEQKEHGVSLLFYY